MSIEKLLHIKRLFALSIGLLFFITTNTNASPFVQFKDSSFTNINLHTSFINPNKIITCYPNPAVSYINFKFDKAPGNAKLYIFSFTGRKMTELNVSNTTIKISLENYFRGLYVYQLRDATDKIVESGKFQVKN